MDQEQHKDLFVLLMKAMLIDLDATIEIDDHAVDVASRKSVDVVIRRVEDSGNYLINVEESKEVITKEEI